MKITGVETFPLSFKQERVQRKFLLVRITTDAGITGIGESSDCYGHQIPLAVREVIEGKVKQLIIGEDPFNVEGIWNKMRDTLISTGLEGIVTHAMSGVEIALWDIVGKAVKQPVYKLLGGARDTFRVYASTEIGLKDTPLEKQAKEALTYLDQGFTAIKIRVPGRPKWDEDIVRMVRNIVGGDVDLMVDAYQFYPPGTAVKMARRLERYDLFFLEEPVPAYNVRALARVKASTTVPIAAGEHVYTKYGFRELIANNAVDVLQPDCNVTGGLMECKKICALGEAWGLTCVPHTFATAVGLIAGWHLLASTPSCVMGEMDVNPFNPLRDELPTDSKIVKVEKGQAKVPQRPGLGIEINEKTLAKYAIK